MSRTGTSVYPATIDSFDRIGTTNYQDEAGYAHTDVHNEIMDASEKMQAVIGTTAGTSIAKNVLAGQFVATTAGTETFTNKTLTAPVINGAITGDAIATGATVNTGTANDEIVTPKAMGDADVNTRLRSKVIAATRDMTAASGDVSYTGVGFQPTSIICRAHIGGGEVWSHAHADSSKAVGGTFHYGTTTWGTDSFLIALYVDGTNTQTAYVKTFDSNGFTLTWVKTNSPTGTGNLKFICYR
jgi:hypothetical protein